MKKESGTKLHGFRYLAVALSVINLGLFTQCNKNNEVLPTPSSQVSPSAPSGTSPSAPSGASTGGSSVHSPVNGNPSDPSSPQNTSQQPGNSAIPAGGVVYTIKASEPIVDGSKLNLTGGEIIKIESGTRGALLLKNFVGKPGAPVTIVNNSGNTIIQSSGAYGMKIENSKFFRISGSGGGDRQGLIIDGGHIGMSLDNLSSEFEVDHVEVKNNGFAGIMAKTDPSCDKATWRGNFVMQNLKFHDNYVHDMKGEGFYIGNSFFANGKALECGNIMPHEIMNVEVYNNTVKNSGCEGIQAGCVVSGLKIYNNSVTGFGKSPFADAQNNGVQIGEGSSGQMFNNLVQDGPGNGIIVLGQGNTTIYNNIVVNAGSFGAFVDNRGPASGDIAFINNTIVNPKQGGIRTYNEVVNNKFYNNIIAGTSSFIEYGNSAKGEEKNNLNQANIADVQFKNISSGNYRLNQGSPAVNAGINAGINSDFDNRSRPAGGTTDIGAFESM